MRAPFVLLGLALLAACGSRSDDAGAVSPEEDRMLNEAAASQDINATPTTADDGNADTTDAGNAQ